MTPPADASTGTNGSSALTLEQELERLRLEAAKLREENERLRGAQNHASQSQNQEARKMARAAREGGDDHAAADDDDDDEASMDSNDAEDAVMKAIMSNGALSAMVQQADQQNSPQSQAPPQSSSDYVDFASYPTGHRYGGLLSDKGSVSARANFAPQLEVDMNNNNESGSPDTGGSRKKKKRIPSILRRSSYRSTSNSNIGSMGSGSMGNSTRSIGMRIDSESDAEADNNSVTSAGSRGSKGSARSSGMRRNTVHIGELQRQKRKEQAQTRQLRLQSGGRSAVNHHDPQSRTTYPPRRSTRSSIAILRTRGSVAPASLAAAAAQGGHHRASVTSYDDLVDPTLALRRSENKHGSAEVLMFGQAAAPGAGAGSGSGGIDTDAAVHGRRSKEKLPKEEDPIIEGGPGSHHQIPERDLSRFRRTSVQSILTIDSATLDDDDGSLPSDDDDDGAKDGRVVVATSPSTPIDMSAEEEKGPALAHVASQPAIDSPSVGDAPSHARPVVHRHASMDMGAVFLPDSNASVVSSRSRRSSAMPLGGMHASLETCAYDGSSFRSRVTAITRDGEGEEAAAGPKPPRRRAVKRMSQSMRRVSFSGHVQSLLDERLEMYISSMIGNTSHMHKQDERVSFDKFALLSVKPATLASPPPVEMTSGTDFDRFIHEGPRYLDSFFLDTADLLDEYPKKDVDGGNEADLDPMALSTFCFPDGLKVRVVPRAAMEGAKRLGWTGRKADRSHLLVFTDDKGETRNGIAITVRAETASSSWDKVDIIKSLNQRRKMRIASTLISRWYRKMRAPQKPGGSPRHGGILPARGISHAMSVRSDFSRRGHSSESLSSKPVRRVHSIDAISTLSGGGSTSTGGGGNADWGALDSASVGTEKSGKSNKSLHKKATRKMLKSLGLKNPRDRSDSIEDGSKSSNKKRSGLRKKVARFAEMTSGARPLTSDGTSVSVTDVDDETQVSVNTRTSKEKKPLSDWAKEKGKEAYAAMTKADGLGDVAIVEQCYVVIGGRADDQSILHNTLQQLVNYEREEALLRFCGRKNGILQEGQARASLLDSSNSRRPSLGDRNEIDQSFKDYTSRLVSRRHNNLKFIQAECKLSHEQITYCLNGADPLDELNGIGRRFQLQLPIRNSTKIDLPLPLPKIGKEWGFAKLLLSVGPDSTLLALKLLLLERSILVLGDKPDEVTAVCRALLRLIKPFKWASTFMPVLPFAMLDFVNSPVPFVAGMSVEGDHAMQLIEDDVRVMEAQAEGMSIINLKAGALLITSERGIGDKLSLSSSLRKKIHALHRRLSFLAEKKDSSIHSLERFCLLGASPLERLTLQSASSSIEDYFSSLLGDIASGDGWLERYGKMDEASGEYLFHAEWMIEALRAEMRFQEDLIQTQLFHTFVDSERTKIQEIEQARSGDAARFIADWLMFRWKRRND